MASSINADNGVSSGSAGLKSSADSSGVLALQTNGTTAISIDTSQAVSFTNAPTVTGGTANGVAYLNGSKVLTTGSALAFNGSKLGIGTTSFDAPLQVQAITGGISMRLNGRASPADGYSDIGFYNSANTTQHAGIGAATSGLILATNVSAPIQFQINSAEAMRLDTSGNLLVGTTSTSGRSGTLVQTLGSSAIVDSSGTVANGGTLVLNANSSGASFTGFLAVSNVLAANAAQRTQTLYAIMCRGTSNFTATQLATANGSTSGASFTLTCPSLGALTVTNTSGSTTVVNMTYIGHNGG